MRVLQTGEFLGRNTFSRELNGMVVSKTVYQGGVFSGWHAHVNPHITLVVRGRMSETRDSGHQESGPGELVFYGENEVHKNGVPPFGSMNLNLEWNPAFLRQQELSEADLRAALRWNPAARFLVLKIFCEASSGDAYSHETIRMLFRDLVHFQRRKRLREQCPPWLKAVRDRLHDQWDGWPTLAELAQAAGVHPVTISKHFPKYFACTLGGYLRKLKVQRALAMINATPEISLTEVAFACGFSDQSHFIRTFKQETGCLPGQYRRF